MTKLTFTHDDLFTIATDEKGRTYRVLLVSGLPPGYRLEPWEGTKAVNYRGATIREGHRLYAEIEIAEAGRRERVLSQPIDRKRFERFAAEEI